MATTPDLNSLARAVTSREVIVLFQGHYHWSRREARPPHAATEHGQLVTEHRVLDLE